MTPERKTRRECPNAPRQDYETYILYIYGIHSEYALNKIFNDCESNRVFRSFEELTTFSFKIEVKWNMKRLSDWIDATNIGLQNSGYKAYLTWTPPINPFVSVSIPEFSSLNIN